MLISKPEYYEKFHCTADRCPATCCAGWQIVIDEASLEAYRKETGSFGKRLQRSINWKEGVFFQDRERRCAFLNERNLCDLYKELGETSLCKTCTDYPRHMEEFENVREYTLSLSCPEAAHLILSQKDPVLFLEEEIPGEESFEEFDFLLYDKLVEVRADLFKLIQNRKWDIWHRAELVFEMGKKVQEDLDEGCLFDGTLQGTEREKEGCLCEDSRPERPSYEASLGFFKLLYQWEVLEEDWEEHLKKTAELLYLPGKQAYEQVEEAFARWLKEEMPEYSIWLEQLLVYFISTYFCGAVYDNYIASKAKLAVVSTWLIYEMLAARWFAQGQSLSMEEVITLVYRYSRELEHSDENLITMDELLEEIEFFKEK